MQALITNTIGIVEGLPGGKLRDGILACRMTGHFFRWAALAPPLFVVLWSTGFVASKLGVRHIEPFTFLCLRFAVVLVLMLPLALVLRAKWPATRREAANIAVSGALIQGGYLGGCFSAVFHGMPAGVIALIVGLQPIVTAFAGAPFLNERVTATQWLGLALGFGGVMLVMWEKISLEGLTLVSMAWAVLALFSITAGTVYQKRYCASFDLRTGSVIQFAVSLALLLPLAYATETMKVDWTHELVFALAWLVLVLSIGAISLLFFLIQRGEATRVVSLFYLTPITTAAMAYLVFGEKLGLMALAGMVFGIIGVALVVRKSGLRRPSRDGGSMAS